MYLASIFWYLSWPVLVIVAYQLVKFTVLKYETVLEKPLKKGNSEK